MYFSTCSYAMMIVSIFVGGENSVHTLLLVVSLILQAHLAVYNYRIY